MKTALWFLAIFFNLTASASWFSPTCEYALLKKGYQTEKSAATIAKMREVFETDVLVRENSDGSKQTVVLFSPADGSIIDDEKAKMPFELKDEVENGRAFFANSRYSRVADYDEIGGRILDHMTYKMVLHLEAAAVKAYNRFTGKFLSALSLSVLNELIQIQIRTYPRLDSPREHGFFEFYTTNFFWPVSQTKVSWPSPRRLIPDPLPPRLTQSSSIADNILYFLGKRDNPDEFEVLFVPISLPLRHSITTKLMESDPGQWSVTSTSPNPTK